MKPFPHQKVASAIIGFCAICFGLVPLWLWQLRGNAIIQKLGLPTDPAFKEIADLLVPLLIGVLYFGSLFLIAAYGFGSIRTCFLYGWNGLFHPDPTLPQKKLRTMRTAGVIAFFLFCFLSVVFLSTFFERGNELYQHHTHGIRATAIVQGEENRLIRYQFTTLDGRQVTGHCGLANQSKRKFPAPGSRFDISYLPGDPEHHRLFEKVDLSGWRGVNHILGEITYLVLCLFSLFFAVMVLRKARECGRILATRQPEEEADRAGNSEDSDKSS